MIIATYAERERCLCIITLTVITFPTVLLSWFFTVTADSICRVENWFRAIRAVSKMAAFLKSAGIRVETKLAPRPVTARYVSLKFFSSFFMFELLVVIALQASLRYDISFFDYVIFLSGDRVGRTAFEESISMTTARRLVLNPICFERVCVIVKFWLVVEFESGTVPAAADSFFVFVNEPTSRRRSQKDKI